MGEIVLTIDEAAGLGDMVAEPRGAETAYVRVFGADRCSVHACAMTNDVMKKEMCFQVDDTALRYHEKHAAINEKRTGCR